MTGRSASSLASSGFSPTPLPNAIGTATPTLIAQPFYRELESVSFDYQNAAALPSLPLIEFIENGQVFLWVSAHESVQAGIVSKQVFAQRINGHAATAGSITYMQTALPVGIYVEPNVSIRIRVEAGDAADSITNIVFMLGKPQADDPREQQ